MRHNVCLNITKLLRSPHKHPELRTLGTVYCREEFEYDIAVTMTLFFSTCVNPLVSTVSGHPQKEGEREGRKGGHSMIFTWIDATVL